MDCPSILASRIRLGLGNSDAEVVLAEGKIIDAQTQDVVDAAAEIPGQCENAVRLHVAALVKLLADRLILIPRQRILHARLSHFLCQ